MIICPPRNYRMSFFVYQQINILHQNINGLISKCDLLTLNLEYLENEQNSVLYITEHNMLISDRNTLKIPNYTLASVYARKNRHGGSCVLVHNSLQFTPLNEINKYSIENIIECSGIELREHKLYAICIYRPPKSIAEDLNKFFLSLNSLLSHFCFNKNKLILCGDFNINVLNKSKESSEFIHILQSYNLKLGFKEPTRPTSGTCIDNIVYNIRGCKSKTYEFALSDHTPQLLTCPVKISCSLKYWYVEKRDYSKENIDKFKDCIDSLGFNDTLNTEDPNIAFNSFYELFTLFYYLCFRKIQIRISAKVRPKWLSKGIRQCCKRKRKLLWEYRKNRNPDSKARYMALSSRLNKITKLTQKSLNMHYIHNAPNKCKATWNVINNNKEQIQEICFEGNIINEPNQMANTFNDFFINQITKLTTNQANITIAKNPKSLFFFL